MTTIWEHGGSVQDLIITMNCYALASHFLDYVFKRVTGITREILAYFPAGQDISLVTRDSLPSLIENIRKELAAIGRSLPFVTSESAHETVEKCLGEDEAFCFMVECSLATDQPIHFGHEPTNVEEAAAQVDQALAASHEIAREEPYVPFKGKGIVEDDEPPSATNAWTSSSVQEISGSSHTRSKQEPWNPPSPTPFREHV